MKKKILLLLLVLVLLIGLMPMGAMASLELAGIEDNRIVTEKYGTENNGVFPASIFMPLAWEGSEIYQIVTVEKYDAAGHGTFLLEPTRVTKITTGTCDDWVTTQLGDKIKVSDYMIAGYQDDTQSDGYLDNGDMGESSKWLVWTRTYNRYSNPPTQRKYPSNQDLGYMRTTSLEMMRIIYSPDGSQPNMDASDQDDLIMFVSGLSAEEKSTASDAYQAALNVILDRSATQEEVDAAKSALESSLMPSNPAVAIMLNPNQVKVSVGQTKTVTATLLTADNNECTDTVTWSVEDTSIATVDRNGTVTGVANGTTKLTAKANDNAWLQIDVTVGDIKATGISLPETATVEEQNSTRLIPVPEPADTTDIVTWSVEDPSIATVDADGVVSGLKPGTTKVFATVNGHKAECVLTVTESPYVYFLYENGDKKYAEEDGSFNLSALDVGKFVVAHMSDVSWSCNDMISAGGDELKFHYWVNSSTGAWLPSGTQPTKNVTVSAPGFSSEFKINYQATSGITELKNYINNEEVTNDAPYTTDGIVNGVYVTTKGLKDGQWITIPTQALKYSTSDTTGNIRFVGSEIWISRHGEAVMTVSLLGESVSSQFKAVCNYIPVESIEVVVPDPAYIESWNALGGYYGGLRPYSGFQVNITPSNATNRDFEFEALTPDIATYMVAFSNGIIPKKAGTAKFRVYSADNHAIYDDITVNFEYKYKLTNATTDASYTMTVGENRGLGITATPGNATEQRFNWTYSQNGIVRVEDSINTDIGGTSYWTTHSMVALSPGTVTVTGTPYDRTGGCPPVQFTVTVTGSGSESVDHLALAKDDISHGLEYLSGKSMDSFGDEWSLFTTLRAGGTVSEADRTAYCESVKANLDSGKNLNTNDYARLVLTLGAMGKDPANFEGYNLVEKLYNNPNLGKQASNMVCWALIALDSRNYDIPQSAPWTRQNLIDRLLQFQITDGDNVGGFDLSVDGTTGSVDMTGMVLQALAPYNTAEYPAVQAAFEDAHDYLKKRLTLNAGYVEGGTENSCTAAQVVVALCAAGIDPLKSENGYTVGESNLITNLHSFRVDTGAGGFKTYLNGANADLMGTQQTTYALVAYQRFAEGQTRLYDLTDVEIPTDYRAQLTALLEEANGLNQAEYTAETWSALEAAKTAAKTVLDNESAAEEQLKSAAEALSKAIAELKKQTETGDDTLKFTDVAADAYYYDAVKWALEKGITEGTSDTTFSPEAGCTRGQMVTFLWRAVGSPEPAAAANPFTDVKADAYYSKALLWAIENGITNGTSATTFSPEAICTRGQMAAFLYRSAKSPAVNGGTSFTDVAIDAYYSNAVVWAAQEGITNGTGNGMFSPDSDCTRGQMVTFLYRYMAE